MTNPGSSEAGAPAGEELAYVGFWPRVGASLIDSVLLVIILVPIVYAIYGSAYLESDALVQGPLDFLLTWVLPAIAVILFWIYKSATPGKMAIGARIVDARTGGKPSNAQYTGRYFAYLVSMLPLFLGYFWIGWDSRKQGWHDKLANTVVVRTRPRSGPEPVRFERA